MTTPNTMPDTYNYGLEPEWIADGWLNWPNSKFDGPASYQSSYQQLCAASRIERVYPFYETMGYRISYGGSRKYRLAYRKRAEAAS